VYESCAIKINNTQDKRSIQLLEFLAKQIKPRHGLVNKE